MNIKSLSAAGAAVLLIGIQGAFAGAHVVPVAGFAQGAGPSAQPGDPERHKGPGPGREHRRQDHREQRDHRDAGQWRQWQARKGWQAGGAWHGHPNWQGHRAAHWDVEHRTWAQRGGYGGYYIPRNRFVIYFGPAHPFRIRARPVIYMGYPRFSYGGYSYMMVDPYPEDWDPNWYATDDVYIDYNDGYYLYNRRHPGVAVAVMVVR